MESRASVFSVGYAECVAVVAEGKVKGVDEVGEVGDVWVFEVCEWALVFVFRDYVLSGKFGLGEGGRAVRVIAGSTFRQRSRLGGKAGAGHLGSQLRRQYSQCGGDRGLGQQSRSLGAGWVDVEVNSSSSTARGRLLLDF